ncbi:VOC family protein [Alkalicoccus chagannorensis]|uniref:VOC family protein n=1 Tax=Alkalicoccus chagannorensis TaxID=427072 RepID=UPI0003FA4205|nr:VOC family protein [Alkalicoccus chagannorensis]
MKAAEINFVVQDSLQALELYESIFDVERVEVTDMEKGANEAIFRIYDVTFHMLDENAEYHLYAPALDHMPSVWFNITVHSISPVYDKAMELDCREIQPVTEMPGVGVSNAVFKDPFGHVWMLHEVHNEQAR